MSLLPWINPRAGLLVLLLLLASCKVDQQKEVEIYRKVLDADAPGRPNRLTPDEPLTLERALVLANMDNERLSLAGEDYLQAIIDKKRVLAEFLPTVNLSPRFLTVDEAVPGGKRHALDVPIEGGYGNFNAFRSVADFQRAASTIEQRRALLLNFKASLLLDVAQAYYQVLRSEQQVVVLQNSLSVQEERVRDVEAQVKVGTGRPLDLAQARAQAASTRVLVVQARGDVGNSRSILAFLIGAPRIDGPLIDRFEAPRAIEPLDRFMQQALQQRQDLLAARAAVLAARHGVEAAVAQYYPSVSLNLDYFVYRESVPSASLYTALLEANIPLFTAGRIHADVRTAWSIFRQTKLSESLTRRQVVQDVDLAYRNFATSVERLRELSVQVAAAREAFEQAADLVRVGRATNLERLVAQDQLLTAQLQLTSEAFNHKVAFLDLQRVAGLLGLAGFAPAATTAPATQP